MFSKVIIPVDFSEASQRAFEAVALLAPQARCQLLHVVEPTLHAYPPFWTGEVVPAAQLVEQALTNARQAMNEMVAGAKALPSPLESEVVVGALPDTIVEHAKGEAADLLAVCSHGRGGVSRWVMGSVAERVLREAPCPVVVAREAAAPTPLRRVVVGVDLSGHSKRALELAGRLCAQHGASLEVVYAWMQPHIGPYGALSGQLLTQMEQEVAQHLADFVRGAELPSGLEIHQATPPGPPTSVLVERLKENPPDLLVLGTHGRRGFRRFVLGSVAETTVRYAPCTTLVVP